MTASLFRKLALSIPVALVVAAFALGCDSGASAMSSDGGRSLDASRDAMSDVDGRGPSDSATSSADAARDAPLLSPHLTVSTVSLFQTVEYPVFAAGEIQPIPTIVADKPAVARILVSADTGFSPTRVRAVAEIVSSSRSLRFESELMVDGTSDVDDESSYFVIPIAASALDGTSSIRFFLTSDDGARASGEHPAQVPSDGGTIEFEARPSPPLRLELIRFHHMPSGAAGLPVVGSAELTRLRRFLTAWLPISNRQLTIHLSEQIVESSAGIQGSGGAVPAITSAYDTVTSMWRADSPAPHTVYIGLVTWDRALFQCPGCGGGYATLVPSSRLGEPSQPLSAATYWEPTDREVFVGCGQFPEQCGQSVNTWFGVPSDAARYVARLDAFADSLGSMLHEMGHALSLGHAPCQTTSDLDSSYPETRGALDETVYDGDLELFRPASLHTDFMGYCQPRALSRYHYERLADAIAALNR